MIHKSHVQPLHLSRTLLFAIARLTPLQDFWKQDISRNSRFQELQSLFRLKYLDNAKFFGLKNNLLQYKYFFIRNLRILGQY